MPASAWRTPWTVAKPKTPAVAVRWRERRRSRPHPSRRRPNLTRNNPTRPNNPNPKSTILKLGPQDAPSTRSYSTLHCTPRPNTDTRLVPGPGAQPSDLPGLRFSPIRSLARLPSVIRRPLWSFPSLLVSLSPLPPLVFASLSRLHRLRECRRPGRGFPGRGRRHWIATPHLPGRRGQLSSVEESRPPPRSLYRPRLARVSRLHSQRPRQLDSHLLRQLTLRGQSAIVCVRELVCREGGAGCSPTCSCTGPVLAL